MKLRREKPANFYFTSVEEFLISLPNGASFSGKSINDICHIWSSPSLNINVVKTRSVSKKRQLNDKDKHDDPVDQPSNVSNEPIREQELQSHVHISDPDWSGIDAP
jgi:hypothetical protein